MGQNIVNCVTRRWGGRLSTVSLLSYRLSSHLLLRRFPQFCCLLFRFGFTYLTFSLPPPSPPCSPRKPSICSHLLLLSPLFLPSFLHTSVLFKPLPSLLFISCPLVFNTNRQNVGHVFSCSHLQISIDRLTYFRKYFMH